MPRVCTICAHPKRQEIDRALVERQSFRSIAARFGVSATSLMRHHDDHLPEALLKAQKVREITRADDLVDRLIELSRHTQEILAKARKDENNDLALKAIARAEKQLELQARLIGELKEANVVNVFLSAEWQAVQQTVLQALLAHPEARLAVASALGRVEVSGHA